MKRVSLSINVPNIKPLRMFSLTDEVSYTQTIEDLTEIAEKLKSAIEKGKLWR